MTYFVDHLKKNIHQTQYAGDDCGFIQTPIEKREFTNLTAYIKQLEEQELYARCPYCQSVKLLLK